MKRISVSDAGSRTLLAILAGFLLLGLAVYQPVFDAGFIWDDNDYVTENPLLHEPGGLIRIWTTTLTPQYYPMVFSSFWLEHRLWGLEPAGYHIVNVLLHAINAFLVGLVLRRLGVRAAWWIAVLFAVHPVHVESVAWITERKNVLSGAFYLLALLSYLSFESTRRATRYGLAFGLFVLALLSKTVASTFPGVVGLLLLWRNRRLTLADMTRLAPFVGVALALSSVTVRLERRMVGVVGSDFDLGWWERIQVASRALVFYPMKLLWPHPLIFNYPRWELESGWFGLAWPLGVAVVGGAALLGLWRAGRRESIVALLFFGMSIFPALGFFDVYPFRYSFVADHFQYLASIGILALAVGTASMLYRRLERRLPRRAEGLGRTLGVGIVLVLAVLTWRQSHSYHDLESLWTQTLTRNPDSWIAHNNLASLQLRRGEHREALAGFDEAVRCKPSSAESHTGRGIALAGLERTVEARAAYDRALELDPTYPQASLRRAELLLDIGRHDAAVADLDRFLGRNPSYMPGYRTRALAHMGAGRIQAAVNDITRAIELGANFEAYNDRGVAHMRMNRPQQALVDFNAAIAGQPDIGRLYVNRALAHLRLDRADAALEDLETALARGATGPAPHTLRGRALSVLGRRDDACSAWNVACQLGDCADLRASCAPR